MWTKHYTEICGATRQDRVSGEYVREGGREGGWGERGREGEERGEEGRGERGGRDGKGREKGRE